MIKSVLVLWMFLLTIIVNGQSKELFLQIWNFKSQVALSEQSAAKLQQFKSDKDAIVQEISELEEKYYSSEGNSNELKEKLLSRYFKKHELIRSIKKEGINNQDEALMLELLEFIRPADLRAMLNFNNLDENKAAVYKKWLNRIAHSEIGSKPENFILKNRNGEKVSLKDFEGKIIWIDSWASKCKPCIKKLMRIRPIYSLYNPKGFEIVALSWDYNASGFLKSIDDAKADWIKIIDKFNFNWVNLFDENDKIMEEYFGSTGKNILIDKDGKIIGYDLKPLEIERILEKKLH